MNKAKPNIVYLKNNEIDKTKWNICIDTASNGLIYGYAFYLDAVCKNWDCLILNDYESVMPITWKKKYGIYYLYQPFFAASLGVFGNNLSEEILTSFLESVPKKFNYWDIYLNRGNVFSTSNFKLYQRSNYILNLKSSYKNISAKFSKNHLRNIQRAVNSGYTAQKNIPVKDVITLAQKQSKNFSSISTADYKNFQMLYEQLSKTNKAICYGVFNEKGKLISSCVYFFSHSRAYYILAGNHPDGRRSGASHFLINAFIKDNAEKDLILDFEGSSIASLANFYSKFGAQEEKYAAIKRNKLPALLRFFKK